MAQIASHCIMGAMCGKAVSNHVAAAAVELQGQCALHPACDGLPRRQQLSTGMFSDTGQLIHRVTGLRQVGW